MKWNWQQPDWLDFRWNGAALTGLEASFLQQAGVPICSIKHLGDEDRAHPERCAQIDALLSAAELNGIFDGIEAPCDLYPGAVSSALELLLT